MLYLKPNVVIEPLVNRWYAWSHLISPATLAMNVLSRHITIMESYLADPEIHAEAVRNPKMKGGPFIDIPGDRTTDIGELLETTRLQQAKLIDFALAIRQLDKLLLAEGRGFGMQSLYPKIPSKLRGFVELFYDRNNNASFRFFEPLLYKSDIYNTSDQSIALWITNNDSRPFCLSTPRLNHPEVIHVPIAFDSVGIDNLAKMKHTPMAFGDISELLSIPNSQLNLFRTFFTESRPPDYRRYLGENIRMRYFGHACILIETKHVSVLIDPVVSYYGYDSDVEHFSDADLPATIDYVLITHNHQDHILFETLLPLRHRIKNLIVPASTSGKLEDPDIGLMFRNIGFSQVLSIAEMQEVLFNDVKITGLPFTGEHSDLNILTKMCYLLEIDNFKLLFLADSRIVEEELYRHIHREIGDVDVVFLGMECDGAPLTWLYGPLLTHRISREQDNSRRLAGSNCDEGMRLIKLFNPREVYVYAMGQEPWVEFISSIKYTNESNPIVQSNALINRCLNMGVVAERLYGEKEIFYNRKLV